MSERARTSTLNWNDLSGKEAQSPISFTGSYAVDSTGRAPLSNLSDGATFGESPAQLFGICAAQQTKLSCECGNVWATCVSPLTSSISFRSQCAHGIDHDRPACWDVTSHHGHQYERC